jgi:flagellin
VAISIQTNVAGERALLALNRVARDMDRSVIRLTTQTRLRAEAYSSFYAADILSGRLRGLSGAGTNIQTGVSALTLAEATLTTLRDDLIPRLIDIATQAADGLTTDAQRAVLDQEFQSIKQQINDLVSGTTFAGRGLLDGSIAAAVDIQVGPTGGDDYQLDFTTDFRTTAAAGPLTKLGAVGAGLSVDTQANAQTALTELNGSPGVPPNVVTAFANSEVNVTARLSTLELLLDANALQIVETTAAQGLLIGADIAAETARLVLLQLQADAGASALQASTFSASAVLSVLSAAVGRRE